MKKELILYLALFLILINGVNALEGKPCVLNVSMVNQDPYPAIPNDYVTVVFQVSGVENPNCNGAKFELINSYPFSLDENNSMYVLNGTTWTSAYKYEWMIPYKLRINKDALDSDYTLTVKYLPGDADPSKGYIVQDFNVSVEDARTSFDAVIQESTTSEVSIAIANTGKYTANSVVVRIPEQENYKATGTDGQMVGNLESGDYTIVGFTLSSIQSSMQFPGNQTQKTAPQSESNKLKFDVYYTDNIGERRVVNMELALNNEVSSAAGNFTMKNGAKTTSNASSWYPLAIVLIVMIAGIFIYRKFSKKIQDKKKNSKSEPDWIINSKAKERKK